MKLVSLLRDAATRQIGIRDAFDARTNALGAHGWEKMNRPKACPLFRNRRVRPAG
jgi:hypothetical protein